MFADLLVKFAVLGLTLVPLAAEVPAAQAQEVSVEPIVLWPQGAPGAKGSTPADVPVLIPFIPDRVKTSTGILILPGGGYTGLSLPTEGYEIAHFLNAAGIPAFVLKYRIAPSYRYPTQLRDGQRALRYLRANAARYRLQMIGVAGFSAGGHLASQMGTSFDQDDPAATDSIDRMSSRPDFLILGYPVISTPGFAAEGSLRNIDPDPTHPVNSTKPNVVTVPPMDPKLVDQLSSDRHVSAQTPPTFLVCADDDHSVFPENAVLFYLALHKAGVAAELHIYEHGRHGFGLAAWDPVDRTWTSHMLDWLRINNFLPEEPKR